MSEPAIIMLIVSVVLAALVINAVVDTFRH